MKSSTRYFHMKTLADFQICISVRLSININSPVGKLLVLINQSLTLFTKFSTELKKLMEIMIRNKIYETSFADNETLKFYFRRKSRIN